MATVKLIVDGYEHRFADRTSCVLEYFVDGDLEEGQKPRKGQPYNYVVPDWPGNDYLVTEWYLRAIMRRAATNLSAPVAVTPRVYRMVVNGARSLTGVGVQRKTDRVIRRYTYTDFKVTPEMLGLRKANELDEGRNFDEGRFIRPDNLQDIKDLSTPRIDHDGDGWTEAIDGYARKGDWVAVNARPKKVRNSTGALIDNPMGGQSAGNVRVEFCPWVHVGGLTTDLKPMHINDKISLLVHHVEYWIPTNSTFSINFPNQYWGGWVDDWGPRNGTLYGPLFEMPPRTDGRWLCQEQQLGCDWEDDGSELIHVERSFVRTPLQLWSPGTPNPTLMVWNRRINQRWRGNWGG